jgi:hypothetical protein
MAGYKKRFDQLQSPSAAHTKSASVNLVESRGGTLGLQM